MKFVDLDEQAKEHILDLLRTLAHGIEHSLLDIDQRAEVEEAATHVRYLATGIEIGAKDLRDLNVVLETASKIGTALLGLAVLGVVDLKINIPQKAEEN